MGYPSVHDIHLRGNEQLRMKIWTDIIMRLRQAYESIIWSLGMAEFNQQLWLYQLARMRCSSKSNTASTSSALQAVAESYTTKSYWHKKRWHHNRHPSCCNCCPWTSICASAWEAIWSDPKESIICIIDATKFFEIRARSISLGCAHEKKMWPLRRVEQSVRRCDNATTGLAGRIFLE